MNFEKRGSGVFNVTVIEGGELLAGNLRQGILIESR